MRITHLGHACVLLEVADERILVDPGTLAGDLSQLRDLSAVLVTHQHPDHLDPQRLPALMAANPKAAVWCDPESVEVLAGLDVEATAHGEDPLSLGEVTVSGVGTMHALIHEDIPRITNVGVLVTAPGEPRFYHPGDALDGEPGEVDVLAFPLNAPWQRSRDMTALLRRIGADQAFPIHDGLLNGTGRELYLSQSRTLGSAQTHIRDLSDAHPTEFTV